MKTPRRIVSLISSATEILYLLGLDNRVVGVSHECDYPADVATKPRLTRSLIEAAASSREIDDQVRQLAAGQAALYTIDVPRLAELAPDLIITQAQCDVCAVRYEDVARAVRETPALQQAEILALNPHRFDDVLADVVRVGAATGAEPRARAVRDELAARARQIRERAREIPRGEIPRVLSLEWIEPPMVAANWTPELIQWAGGEAGLARGGEHSTYAEWQQILDYDPQVVVIMPCGFDLPRSVLEARTLPRLAGWSQISAVRELRVYATDGNAYFNRSGPRLVDSLEILAHLFHPRRFSPPPVEEGRAWRKLDTRDGQFIEVQT